jgi:hypothetical protein
LRRLVRAVLFFAAFIAVLAIAYFALLAPTRDYSKIYSAQDIPNINEKILKSMPKNFSLQNRRLKISFSLPEEDISNLIMSNIDAEDIMGVETVIASNKMEIYLCKKLYNLIPVEASVILSSKVEGDVVKLKLDKSKLGKFELDKRKILNELKNHSIPFFEVRPEDGEIILKHRELGSIIKVTELTLEDKTASVEGEIRISSLEDLRKISQFFNK